MRTDTAEILETLSLMQRSEVYKNKPMLLGGIINKRPIFFCTLCLIAGIFVGAVCAGYAWVMLAVLAAAVVAAAILFKRKLVVSMLLFFILGYLSLSICYLDSNIEACEYQSAAVSGRVCRVQKGNEEYKYGYLLENVMLDAKAIEANAVLYTDNAYYVGDKLSATAKVEAFNYDFFDSYSMSYFNSGVQYKIFSDGETYLGSGGLKWYEAVRERVSGSISANMSGESAGVALSLVLGDKTLLSDEVNEAVKTSGLSHIFSVSGLHIGFLVALVFFITSRCKLSPYFGFGASFIMMILYGIVVGFPSSMVRAIIMTGVGFVAFIAFKRPDSLNLISLAAAAILIFRPFSLFELGFQMSFAAMLGIICFYRPLYKKFRIGKGKIGGFIGGSLAMSVSANSFLLGISVNTFAAFGVYFCLANIIVIPLVGIVYALTMTVSLLCLISPYCGVLFVPIDYLYKALTAISVGVSSLPYATVSTSPLGLIALFYAVLLFVVSKYILIKKTKKTAIAVGILAVSVLYGFLFL